GIFECLQRRFVDALDRKVMRRYEGDDTRACSDIARNDRAWMMNRKVAHAPEHGVGQLGRLLEIHARHQRRDLVVVESAAQIACTTKAAADHASDAAEGLFRADRKSTRLNSSHVKISYAVF